MQRGLGGDRVALESLSRFMSAYARLAKLPPPKLAPLDVAAVIDRVATLEKGHNIQIAGGPKLSIQGDSDQLEQLLINLIRTAVDAVRETGGAGPRRLAAAPRVPRVPGVWVDDEGPGLSNTGNLFVPFFTTQAGRVGHRPGPVPADRRGPRRQSHAREPRRPHRLPRQPAAAAA
jgi:C4-dicarboxylate-specific signal transduction histidine kinase